MPDRPKPTTLPGIASDHAERIRALERLGTPPDAKVIVPGECMEMPGEGTPDEPYRMQPQIDPDAANQLACTDLGLFVGGGQSVGWDAVCDCSIVASDPDRRLFKGIGEAMMYLFAVVGLTQRAFILVRNHPTSVVAAVNVYKETAAVSGVPANVFLMAASETPSPGYPSVVTFRGPIWDHDGYVVTVTNIIVKGLQVDGGSTARGGKSALIQGTARYEDGVLIPNVGITATSSRALAASVDATLVRTRVIPTGHTWLAFGAAFDSVLSLSSAGATYNPAIGTVLLMNNCIMTNAENSAVHTWNVPVTTEVELVRPSDVNAHFTLNVAAGQGVFDLRGLTQQGPTVTTSAGARLEYDGPMFGPCVIAAPSSDQPHHIRSNVLDNLDLTGPALIDIEIGGVTRGILTLRGTQVIGQVYTSRSGSIANPAIDFINADRCNLQVVSPVTPGGGGTFKPYAFDASSTDNVLLWQRHNNYPTAGTDLGTNNRVLPEGTVPITVNGHVIEDEGTPLTQRANMNFVGAGVTVTDTAGETLVTIPSGGGHVIEDEGVPMPAQPNLNFVGAGVTVTDSAPDTIVTISGGGGGGDTLVAWVGL